MPTNYLPSSYWYHQNLKARQQSYNTQKDVADSPYPPEYYANPNNTTSSNYDPNFPNNPLNPTQPGNATPDVRYTGKPRPAEGYLLPLPKNTGAPRYYVEPEKYVNQRRNQNMSREEKLARRYYSEGSALLNAYARLYPRTQQLQAQANNDYGDLQYDYFARNAPRYTEALTNADPYQAELRRQLNMQAMTDLDSDLSPSVQREIQQGSRAAWSQRGLFNTSPSAIAELYALGDRGYQQHNQAMTNALNVGQFNQRVIGDPYLQVMGRASMPNQPDYTPFTNNTARQTVSDLDSFNLNNMLSKRNKSAADRASSNQLIGAGIGAVGSIFGGIMGGV